MIILMAVGCRPTKPAELERDSLIESFLQAAGKVQPSLTLGEAREIDWLVESSPRQFDGQLNGVAVQCTFEDERLVLGRVGVEGSTLSDALLVSLSELHGTPTTLSDSWTDPATGNTRPERKWAFPNGTDLVEHDAYVPKEGEPADRAMPSETVLRVGG